MTNQSPLQVGDEDGDQQPHAHALACDEADAEDQLLRYAVEKGAESERGAGVVVAARLVAAPASASDHPVEREVGERAEGEADPDDTGVTDLVALLPQVEA